MKVTHTLAELDERVEEVGAAVTLMLEALPVAEQYGDWDTLIERHRQGVQIIGWGCKRISEIEPPAHLANEWAAFGAAKNEHLMYERAVLTAAEDRDFEAYRTAIRAMSPRVRLVKLAAAELGLSWGQLPPTRKANLYMTLPSKIFKALAHRRREHHAGRRWEA